ncbi:hypothetical protein Poli38472_005677 [Pythium oligandrum]|uniref:Uncharacterized protein n=1 Tax=Pythium oligandrum TaxID=41045 RepID=A0A8K1FJF1_PYTOL|nr:hypothetical protein Poli38472_005677 [Pythium oligandrum]|eukprot:TMW63059.1 hypothetical protein Poli38472_005677 [Pythium oligandrum]
MGTRCGSYALGGQVRCTDDLIDRKFHDTLDEVVALKRILQDFLAEPQPQTACSDSPSPQKCPSPMEERRLEYGNQIFRHIDGLNNLPDASYEPTQEAQESQGHIQISKGSERWLRNSVHFEPNFQARMQHYMTKTARKREQLRSELEDEAKKHVRPKPAINQRSQRMRRGVEHLMAWNDEKTHKLSHLRAEERRREEEEIIGKPQLSRRSKKLMAARDDELARCRVEDRLHLLGLIYEYQQEERLIQQTQGTLGTRPTMAPHSSRLQRGKNITAHDRLFQLANTKRADKTKSVPSPDSQGPVKSKKSSEQAVERLYQIHNEYQKRRHEMAEHQERQQEQERTRTKLSEKSHVLAKTRLSKCNELSAPVNYRQCDCCQVQEEISDDAPTPPRRVVSTSEAASIFDKHVRWREAKEKRCKAEKTRREQEEERKCTFKNPYYHDAWDTMEDIGDTHQLSPRSRKANTSFFDKSVRWAERREQQLEHERKLWDEIKLRECTFQPALSGAASTKARPQSSLQGTSSAKGYFSRTNQATPVTPMLSIDTSDVATEDLLSEELESEYDGVDQPEAPSPPRSIRFFNHGRQMYPCD